MKTIIALLFLSLCFLGCEKKDSGSRGATTAGADAGAGSTPAGATTAGANTGAGVNPNTGASPNPPTVTFVEVCDRTELIRTLIVSNLVPSPDRSWPEACKTLTKKDLKKLEAIWLVDSSRDKTTLKTGDFSGLSGLKNIKLHNAGLTTLPEGIFDGLTALEEISLAYNNLTTLPEGIFDGLTALKRVWITMNYFSDTEVSRIREEYPHVTVSYIPQKSKETNSKETGTSADTD